MFAKNLKYLNGHVAADGTGQRSLGVGLAEHHAAALDSAKTFPDHANNWARDHVVDQVLEEWLLLQVGVVLLHMSTAWSAHFQSDELKLAKVRKSLTYLEATLLESLDNLANETTLNTIGLDSNESTLLVCSHSDSLNTFMQLISLAYTNFSFNSFQ